MLLIKHSETAPAAAESASSRAPVGVGTARTEAGRGNSENVRLIYLTRILRIFVRDGPIFESFPRIAGGTKAVLHGAHHLLAACLEWRLCCHCGSREVHVHDRLREIRELQGERKERKPKGIDEVFVDTREDRLTIRALTHDFVIDELLMERLVKRREDELLALDTHRQLVHHERLHWFRFCDVRHRIHYIDLLRELESLDLVLESSFRMHVAIFVQKLYLIFL